MHADNQERSGVDFAELSLARQRQVMQRAVEAWVKRRGRAGWRLRFVYTEEQRRELQRAGWLPVVNTPPPGDWQAAQYATRDAAALALCGRWAIRRCGARYVLFAPGTALELRLDAADLEDVSLVVMAAEADRLIQQVENGGSNARK